MPDQQHQSTVAVPGQPPENAANDENRPPYSRHYPPPGKEQTYNPFGWAEVMEKAGEKIRP